MNIFSQQRTFLFQKDKIETIISTRPTEKQCIYSHDITSQHALPSKSNKDNNNRFKTRIGVYILYKFAKKSKYVQRVC